jgi:AcrR family transcriptional regulator
MARAPGRKERVEQRRQRIIDVARERAESGGWARVTTRALADAIGYTQPVLYGHFPGGKAEIMTAVALTGFAELTDSIRAALNGRSGRDATTAAAEAYLDFAAAHPAVYEAMFSLPIEATFAQAGNEPELQSGFLALGAALGTAGAQPPALTEVFWGALHGISQLERTGRQRPEHRGERVRQLAERFGPASAG